MALKFFKNRYNNYPVLFLHGLAGGLKDWEKTITKISNTHYEMRFFDREKIYHNYFGDKEEKRFWNVSYYSMNILDDSLYGNLNIFALRLKNIIDKILFMTKQNKVIIIAHSMGGLIAKRYMVINKECWDSVYKLLTVATPHKGFGISFGIIQQLRDLKRNSHFISKLDDKWKEFFDKEKEKKWGVVGAIDTKAGYTIYNDPNATDSGGIGYVEISSSIPYDEWAEAIGDNIEKEFYDTKHFGFRIAVKANHTSVLLNEGVFKGIAWAMK